MAPENDCIPWMWYITVPNPARPDLPTKREGPFGTQSEAQNWIDARSFAKEWGAYVWQCKGDDEPTT